MRRCLPVETQIDETNQWVAECSPFLVAVVRQRYKENWVFPELTTNDGVIMG